MSTFEIGQTVWTIDQWQRVLEYRVASKPRKDGAIYVTPGDYGPSSRKLISVRRLHSSRRAALEAVVRLRARQIDAIQGRLQDVRDELAACQEEEPA